MTYAETCRTLEGNGAATDGLGEAGSGACGRVARMDSGVEVAGWRCAPMAGVDKMATVHDADDAAIREMSGPGTERDGTDADPATPDGLARIDQVAKRTGLTKRTLRYYEELGLLEPPTRTEGGYRLYTAADIERLERVKRLKHLMGFSLAEIRELVRAEEEREQVRAAWQRETNPHAHLGQLDEAEALVRQQLRLVDEKLAGLEEMRGTLRERIARYERLRGEIHEQLARERHVL